MNHGVPQQKQAVFRRLSMTIGNKVSSALNKMLYFDALELQLECGSKRHQQVRGNRQPFHSVRATQKLGEFALLNENVTR